MFVSFLLHFFICTSVVNFVFLLCNVFAVAVVCFPLLCFMVYGVCLMVVFLIYCCTVLLLCF